MKKLLILTLLLFWPVAQAAPLVIDITEGMTGALPIAVVPFGWQGPGQAPTEALGGIVDADLKRSGRFKTLPSKDMLAFPHTGTDVDFRDWKVLGMESLVVGQIRPNGPGGYIVRFQLFDVFKGEQLMGFTIPTTAHDLRATAHQISDFIYEKLTGQRGAFATRVAYITSIAQSTGKPKITLQVADADGHHPQTIVTSTEPLMSPAWSPDGLKLAYVSFENGRPSIFVQEVFTGKRQRVASYKGINGAPAWSPDGRKLALTLSKDGNPDIFILDLARRTLQPLTRHYAIDTEPAWSPDGKYIVWTSNRGGKPQIYRMSSSGGEAERITFEGKYNARASYSQDGKLLTMVTQVGSDYRIGVLEMESRQLRILSNGALDESPSFAPNGSMVIYATKINGPGELAAASVDGRVKQRLALQTGNVREPAWAPYSK